jgi:hypothetical protein
MSRCLHLVDINLETNWCTTADPFDRRRRLRSYSRFEETPPRQLIELNSEGNDYLFAGDFPEEDFGPNWQQLQAVLQEAPRRLTRKQILEEWPAGTPAPTSKTLWRWLIQAAGPAWARSRYPPTNGPRRATSAMAIGCMSFMTVQRLTRG